MPSGKKMKGAKAVKSKGFKTDVKNSAKFSQMKKSIRKERKHVKKEALEKMIDVRPPLRRLVATQKWSPHAGDLRCRRKRRDESL